METNSIMELDTNRLRAVDVKYAEDSLMPNQAADLIDQLREKNSNVLGVLRATRENALEEINRLREAMQQAMAQMDLGSNTYARAILETALKGAAANAEPESDH